MYIVRHNISPSDSPNRSLEAKLQGESEYFIYFIVSRPCSSCETSLRTMVILKMNASPRSTPKQWCGSAGRATCAWQARTSVQSITTNRTRKPLSIKELQIFEVDQPRRNLWKSRVFAVVGQLQNNSLMENRFLILFIAMDCTNATECCTHVTLRTEPHHRFGVGRGEAFIL